MLRAGAAKVDITPPLTIPYLGYEPRHALFEGVHDPLYARALAVDDGQNQAILIAADSIGYSNDILGPGRHFTAKVRRLVEAQTGVPAGNVMLAASHAHSTPETLHIRRLLDTPAAGPWLEVLIDQLVSAAVMAVRNHKPCRLKVGTGEVHGLARNRRVAGGDGMFYPRRDHAGQDSVASLGTIDPLAGVILLQAVEEDSCILVTNAVCHPVTVQVQPLVSADFPGVAMDLVERTVPGCTSSLFLQGACGDQSPMRNDTRDFRDVERYGLLLGGEAIKMVGRLSAPDYPESTPVVAVRSQVLSLPGREVLPYASVRSAYDEAERKLAQAATNEERQRYARERRLAEEALVQTERADEPNIGEVQVMRLGDAALVGWPGEPFVELGLEVKEHAVAPYSFVVGYANGYLGYFANPADWAQGGYEVGNGPWSRVGSAAGAMLVEEALALIRELWS
jgi:hypothetical protein